MKLQYISSKLSSAFSIAAIVMSCGLLSESALAKNGRKTVPLSAVPTNVLKMASELGDVVMNQDRDELQIERRQVKSVLDEVTATSLMRVGNDITHGGVSLFLMSTKSDWSPDTTYLVVRRSNYESRFSVYGPLSDVVVRARAANEGASAPSLP